MKNFDTNEVKLLAIAVRLMLDTRLKTQRELEIATLYFDNNTLRKVTVDTNIYINDLTGIVERLDSCKSLTLVYNNETDILASININNMEMRLERQSKTIEELEERNAKQVGTIEELTKQKDVIKEELNKLRGDYRNKIQNEATVSELNKHMRAVQDLLDTIKL